MQKIRLNVLKMSKTNIKLSMELLEMSVGEFRVSKKKIRAKELPKINSERRCKLGIFFWQ